MRRPLRTATLVCLALAGFAQLQLVSGHQGEQRLWDLQLRQAAVDSRPCTPDRRATAAAEASPWLRVYVADLPYDYDFAVVNSTMRVVNLTVERPFGEAIGPEAALGTLLYETDISAADLWMYVQLLQSPLRVQCVYDADFVFVPGMFMRADPMAWRNMFNTTLISAFFRNASAVLGALNTVPHVVGYGWSAADNAQLFARPETRKFTFTSTELPQPAQLGPAPDALVNFVQVAPATRVHLSRASAEFTRPYDPAALAATKSALVSESFHAEGSMLKEALAADCRKRPADECVHVDYDDSAASFGATWEAYSRSWYCLQPPQHGILRRMVLECVLAGSIPVLFDEADVASLPYQDLIDWRGLVRILPLAHAEDISAVELLLAQHREPDALHTLRELYRVRALLQYSANPVHDVVRLDQRGTVTRHDDAFTASLKAVARNLCARGLMSKQRCAGQQAASRAL